jgi:2',3'-cyclic-nucleotide 2'-phosphodiesterase / 3'-nucleotidase
MKRPNDFMLKLRTGKDGKPLVSSGKILLMNQPYNFDSAAGIEYLVDLSKPEGSRILIKGFSDDRPFEKNNIYEVAVNSFRGNGGGGHLTEGAEIKKKDLRSRIVSSTDKDLRYIILKSIKSKGTVEPVPINNWKIVPEKWVKKAVPIEYQLLFGNSN